MTSTTSPDGSATIALPGKYLTFALGREDYALPVLKVREIIKMIPITAVPQAPHHVRGVINLRGQVVPVLDLRRRFGLSVHDDRERTCIIVAEVRLTAGPVMMGIVVDEVSEVLNLTKSDIESTPGFGAEMTTDYMLGIARVGDRLKILLDLDRVFGGAEISLCL